MRSALVDAEDRQRWRQTRKLEGPLKDEFQAELRRPAAAGPDHGIGGRYVGCRTAAAEGRPGGRGIVVAKTVLPPVGIGEVRMIQDIEELGAKLGTDPF